MNPFLNMEAHKHEFTQNDTKIYNAILEQPEKVIYLSTSALAREISVSQPALTRFIKMLGYSRYSDFRSDITAWSATVNYSSASPSLPYFESLGNVLAECEKVLTDDYLKELTSYILNFRRIFTTGMAKSYQPAMLMHYLFKKHDIFVTPVVLDELRETADYLNDDDLLIVFSVSTNREIMDKIINTGGKIMLVTTNMVSEYSDCFDRTVVLPFLPPNPETSHISPIIFDVLVEMLDSYVAQTLSEGQK